MNSIMHMGVLFRTRVKDTLKNMEVLLLFFIFPVIALIIQKTMGVSAGMGGAFFIGVFGVMHCAFAPTMVMASLVAEEKEKHTLKVLLFANVSLREYLISTGGFVCLVTMLTSGIFLASGGIEIERIPLFLLYMCIGSIVSVLLGGCIGFYADSHTAANGIAVPIGMIFAFLPMLASFNEGIRKVADYTYGQQVGMILSGSDISIRGNIIIAANMLLFIVLAFFLYKRNKTR